MGLAAPHGLSACGCNEAGGFLALATIICIRPRLSFVPTSKDGTSPVLLLLLLLLLLLGGATVDD